MSEPAEQPPIPTAASGVHGAAHTRIHLALGGQQLGSFDILEVNAKLRTGELPSLGIMAWYPGLREWVALDRVPGVHVLLTPPEFSQPVMHSGAPSVTGDATGGLIPYKNPLALIGYYTGIASLIPVLGFVTGPIALVLGIMGLIRRARQPAIRGAVHAWIAIILGGGSFIVHLIFVAAMVTR